MIINVLIPAIVMLLMVVVGTGLQVGQFRSVLRNKTALVGGSLAQIVLLPAGALTTREGIKDALIKSNYFRLVKIARIFPEVRCNRVTITPHFVKDTNHFSGA